MGKNISSVTALGFTYPKKRTQGRHRNDIGHLSLTDFERQHIATKIASKIPFDEIRDSVTDSKLEQIHWLTKKDLYNIENCFNIGSNAIKHKDDGTSVDAWVNETESRNGKRIAPIVFDAQSNATELLDQIGKFCGAPLEGRFENGKLRVLPTSAEEHRLIQKYISDKKLRSHTFEMAHNKQLKLLGVGNSGSQKVECTERPRNTNNREDRAIWPLTTSLASISFQTSSAIKRNHKETTDRSWLEEPTLRRLPLTPHHSTGFLPTSGNLECRRVIFSDESLVSVL
ncbi:pyr_redox_2 domain-containing protein [Trichonephila clavipes]|nr:pyr_redox_2 domain-containing protein [Trichonephila clavipes]